MTLCALDRQATLEETKQAVALAEKACGLTGRKELEPLRILAGINAKAGRFGEAAAAARTALDVARAAGDRHSESKVRQVLAHYEKLQAETRNRPGPKSEGRNPTGKPQDLPITPEGAAAAETHLGAKTTEAPANR